MQEDFYISPTVGNYIWLTEVHGDGRKIYLMKQAIYNEGPVAFAFQANSPFMGYSGGVFSVCTGHERANHAVYSYGWGTLPDIEKGTVEFFESSNSWGTKWGVNGHFRIHPRCITDVTISGPLGDGVVSHQVGTVDNTVPADEKNNMWPWQPLPECPVDANGCVTDMNGENDYSNTEICVSNALNGKMVRVANFSTEYYYDFVFINGRRWTGNKVRGNYDLLDGVEVDQDGIKFTSDGSVTDAGFKICPMV
jgi:hypothetical protein